jgi:hypothetical protein
MPLRQAMGIAQGLWRLAGFDWKVADYSKVSRRRKTPQVNDGASSAGGQHRHHDAGRTRHGA